METTKFSLPIGDWSNDGHGTCEYFTVEANFNNYYKWNQVNFYKS